MGFPLPSTDPLGTDLQLDTNGDLVVDLSGSLQTVMQADNAAQALRVNLATAIDTYLWDDEVGSYLPDYVDQSITADMEKEIVAMVTEKAMEDDRIIDVSEVVLDDSRPNALVIFVTATVDGTGDITIPITLTGGA